MTESATGHRYTQPRSSAPTAGRRKRRLMTPRARKAALTVHIIASVGWLGAALAMVALSARALISDDPAARVGVYATMHYFDLALQTPLSVTMLLSSLISAVFTKWGLVQHTWVLTKLVLSLTIFVGTPILSAPRQLTLIETIPLGAEPRGMAVEVMIIAFCTAATLAAITAISVTKPWGRTRWYRGAGRHVDHRAVPRGRGQRAPRSSR